MTQALRDSILIEMSRIDESTDEESRLVIARRGGEMGGGLQTSEWLVNKGTCPQV